MQKRHVLVCEGSLCPRELPDVSGPDLGEAGRYRSVPCCKSVPAERVFTSCSWVNITVSTGRPLLTTLISRS